MEARDVSDVIMLGNDIAMQWYALTHDTPLPQPVMIPGTGIPTQVYTQTTQLMLIGLVVVAAVIILRK
jgi:hypothetical protein